MLGEYPLQKPVLLVGHNFQNLAGPKSGQENLHGRGRGTRFDRALAEAVSANPTDEVQVRVHLLISGVRYDEESVVQVQVFVRIIF